VFVLVGKAVSTDAARPSPKQRALAHMRQQMAKSTFHFLTGYSRLIRVVAAAAAASDCLSPMLATWTDSRDSCLLSLSRPSAIGWRRRAAGLSARSSTTVLSRVPDLFGRKRASRVHAHSCTRKICSERIPPIPFHPIPTACAGLYRGLHAHMGSLVAHMGWMGGLYLLAWLIVEITGEEEEEEKEEADYYDED